MFWDIEIVGLNWLFQRDLGIPVIRADHGNGKPNNFKNLQNVFHGKTQEWQYFDAYPHWLSEDAQVAHSVPIQWTQPHHIAQFRQHIQAQFLTVRTLERLPWPAQVSDPEEGLLNNLL